MYIDLSLVSKVKNFVEVAQSKTHEVILKSDRCVVDGKSILGIFSLDLSKPIELVTEDYERFEQFKA